MAKLSPEERERRAERKRQRLALSEHLLRMANAIEQQSKAHRRKKLAPQGMTRLDVTCKCGHRGTILLPTARVVPGVTLRCSQCEAKRKVYGQ